MTEARHMLRSPATISELYAAKVSESEAYDALVASAPFMAEWGRTFAIGAPTAGRLHDGSGNVRICAVDGVEESIWAPAWGIKGVLDAVVRVEYEATGGAPVRRLPRSALELKTGRRNERGGDAGHRAQVRAGGVHMSSWSHAWWAIFVGGVVWGTLKT